MWRIHSKIEKENNDQTSVIPFFSPHFAAISFRTFWSTTSWTTMLEKRSMRMSGSERERKKERKEKWMEEKEWMQIGVSTEWKSEKACLLVTMIPIEMVRKERSRFLPSVSLYLHPFILSFFLNNMFTSCDPLLRSTSSHFHFQSSLSPFLPPFLHSLIPSMCPGFGDVMPGCLLSQGVEAKIHGSLDRDLSWLSSLLSSLLPSFCVLEHILPITTNHLLHSLISSHVLSYSFVQAPSGRGWCPFRG